MIDIGFIGGGNMAGAIISGIVKNNLTNPNNIWVCDKMPEKLELYREMGINATTNISDVLANCDYVVIAVKPSIIPEIAPSIIANNKNNVFISIAAGWTVERLKSVLHENAKLVRIMPNTPALVGEGMSVISNAHNLSDIEIATVVKILATLGEVEICDDSLMDAVTGVSGSGPAYGYMFIDAIASAGAKQGLSYNLALKLACQTIKGAAEMITATGEEPKILTERVCSPGGTTIEAVKSFNQDDLYGIVDRAIEKCTNRSKEL